MKTVAWETSPTIMSGSENSSGAEMEVKAEMVTYVGRWEDKRALVEEPEAQLSKEGGAQAAGEWCTSSQGAANEANKGKRNWQNNRERLVNGVDLWIHSNFIYLEEHRNTSGADARAPVGSQRGYLLDWRTTERTGVEGHDTIWNTRIE